MREMPEIIRRVTEEVPAATFVLGGVGDEALVTEGLSGKLRTENLVLPG